MLISSAHTRSGAAGGPFKRSRQRFFYEIALVDEENEENRLENLLAQ